MKKIIVSLAVVLVIAPFAAASVLHVVEGYDPADPNFGVYNPNATYTGLQQAWGNCSNGDEIVIHAGIYEKIYLKGIGWYTDPNTDPSDPGTLKTFVLYTAADANGVNYDPAGPGWPAVQDRNNIWIHPAGDGKVTLKGEIKIFGTPSGDTHDITIEGFYIDTSYPEEETKFHRSGLYLSCEGVTETQPRSILGVVTMRDCVIYNGTHEYETSYADQGCQFRGGGDHGPYVIEHCTFVNLGGAEGTGYGIYDKKVYHPFGAPVYRSNIVMNFYWGTFTSDFGGRWRYLFDYSDVYSLSHKTITDYQSTNYFGRNSVSMHPQFVSINPNDPLFLMLGPDSPDEVKYGAHDGGPMGARIKNMGLGPNYCGMWGYKQGDKNHDCYVDFYDYILIAEDWLECTHPDCD